MTNHLENVFEAARAQLAEDERLNREHRLTELRDQFHIKATDEDLLPTPDGLRLCLQEYLTLEWIEYDSYRPEWYLRWFPPKKRGNGRAKAEYRRVYNAKSIVKAMNEWKVPREETE